MKIPKIYHFGSLSSKGSFIVMEYLKFGGSYSQADLGQALAEMHKAEPAVSLGQLLHFVRASCHTCVVDFSSLLYALTRT